MRLGFSFLYFLVVVLIFVFFICAKYVFCCVRSIKSIIGLGPVDGGCTLFHNFHILSLSSYPVLIFCRSVGLASSLVVFFKYGITFGVLYCLFSVFFVAFAWGKDIVMEGLSGYHNFFVIDGFKFGVLVFIFREFMFFFGIFWTFFDAALVPAHDLGGT